MDSPKGNRYKARFRNSYQCSALTSAERWVWEKRQSLQQEAEFSGKQVEFEVPPELDRVNDSKRITLPVERWIAYEAAAKKEGIGISAWIAKAAKNQLDNQES